MCAVHGITGSQSFSLASDAEVNGCSFVFVYAQHNVYHRHRRMMHIDDGNESHSTLACILRCEALKELNSAVCPNTFSTALEILKPGDKVKGRGIPFGRHLVGLPRYTPSSHSQTLPVCLRYFWCLVCTTA